MNQTPVPTGSPVIFTHQACISLTSRVHKLNMWGISLRLGKVLIYS